MELYLHLPFCRQKCRYCDFASWAGAEALMPAYVGAVLSEAAARAESLGTHQVETVYLGGGTPSILPPSLLRRLMEGVFALFRPVRGAEISCEANPGTLTEEWLREAASLGVNRLSLGMQAAQPKLLRTLGRIHSHQQVAQSVAMARAAGIGNLNLDLMFGVPGQQMNDWTESLEAALALAPEHLSCYGLIPEEGTPLKAELDSGMLTLPSEELEREMYTRCQQLLAKRGFRQYEISNFALPGRECRHNLGYWRQVPYLGLGVAAASMLPGGGSGCVYRRQTNPDRLDPYLRMVENSVWTEREEERIGPAEARFETLMLSLRTTEGVSDAAFLAMHRRTLDSCCGHRLSSLVQRGLLEHCGDCWRLTVRGMDIMNCVLVELMEEMDQ